MYTHQTHVLPLSGQTFVLCGDKQTRVQVSECLLKCTGMLLNVKEAAKRTGRTSTGAPAAGEEDIGAQADVGRDWALPIPGTES